MIHSGSYPCQILTRSSDIPTEGRNLHYRVRIFTPSEVIDRDAVSPQDYDRMAWGDVDLLFAPFDIGFVLTCNVIRDAHVERFFLNRSEIPASEICGENSG